MASNTPPLFDSKQLLQELPDPLMLTDAEANIIWVNQKAEKVFGISNEEIKGWSFIEIIKINKIDKLLNEALETGRFSDSSYEAATIRVRSEEGKHFFKIVIIPLRKDNKVAGAVIQLTDVTRFKELERLKTDFISIVSHEFRTPLSSITIGVGMLKEGLLGQLTPRGKEMVDALDKDCERLNKLVENLLDLSRIESGHIALETQLLEVEGLVEEALLPLKTQAEYTGVELVKDLEDNLPQVEADFNKIVWVLANLVGNALRYSNAGDDVTVQARGSGKRLFFSVKDKGCGIPKEYQEQIFKKYVQVKGSSGPAGGAGLGLAICKEIVEAHGGQIWVESDEGKGSVFTFTLPLDQQEASSDGANG